MPTNVPGGSDVAIAGDCRPWNSQSREPCPVDVRRHESVQMGRRRQHIRMRRADRVRMVQDASGLPRSADDLSMVTDTGRLLV
jgi:hypothetical protein